LLAALALTFVAHFGALGAALVWDDHHLLGPHGAVARAESPMDLLQSRFWELADGEGAGRAYVRPLTLISLRLDRDLHDEPAGYHATNVILHLGVVALVFLLARRFGAAPAPAAFAAAAFGVFPPLTEAVTFVSGRTDVLAALGGLGALLLHREGPGHDGRRVAAAVLLLAGLLAKEVAIAAMVALVAMTWARQRHAGGSVRARAMELLPATAAVLVYASLRLLVDAPFAAQGGAGLATRSLFAVQALGHYALGLLWPWQPNLVIGSFGWPDAEVIAVGVPVMLVLVTVIVLLLAARLPPRHALWSALGIAALLPVLHLVPISLRAVAADRFLYVPLAAIAVGSALAASAVGPIRTRRGALVAGVLVVALAAATALRTRDYHDEVRLFEHAAARAHTANGQAHFELANLVARRGDAERALDLYAESYARERRLEARYSEWRIPAELLANRALVLSERGRTDEAIPVLEELVRLRPDVARYRLYQGNALARALRFGEADAALSAALRLHPEYRLAANIRSQTRRAKALFETLPPERPDEPTAERARRAQVYQWIGRLEHAAGLWTEVALSPDAGPEALEAASVALGQQRQVLGETPATRALAGALASRASP
jgi:thioredoxin-like negative regulator of GroEL